MFQSQLEGAMDSVNQNVTAGLADCRRPGAKSLYLTDDKEVVVEEGVNDSAAHTIERCLHLILRKVGQSDARECRMVICECNGANDTIFNDRQIREARVGL
jgi:hypothetical protein